MEGRETMVMIGKKIVEVIQKTEKGSKWSLNKWKITSWGLYVTKKALKNNIVGLAVHGLHSVQPPTPPRFFCWWGLKPPNKFSKRMGEGLTWSQIFRGGLLRKRGWLFFGEGGGEVAILTQKNKLKSKVLNNKNKFITKMFLSFISLLKNLIFKGGRGGSWKTNI